MAHLYAPDRLRTIAYDHRGSGRSAPWLGPVSMAMLAADAARVLDERGVDCAHVVGLSMGAMVALELAVRMPARVKSLVLVGGTAGGPQSRVPAARDIARTVGASWRATCAAAPGPRPCCSRRPSAPSIRSASPRWSSPSSATGRRCGPSSSRRWRPPASPGAGTSAACGRRRSSSTASSTRCRPPANAHALAEGIPGAELWMIPGGGHAAPLEHAEESAERLLDWVDRHAGVVPPQTGRRAAVAERVTRPFALHAGAARSAAQVVPAVRSRLRP